MQRMQTRPGRAGLTVLAAGALVIFAGLGLLLYVLLGGDSPVQAPGNKVLRITVPDMKRVRDLPVYDAAPGGYEWALKKSSVHVRGTGWPWQEEANVYIAGHRLGYPGTRSFLVFRDIDKLENGDEVILEDANGTRYTYEVFEQFTFGPNEEHVLRPLEGRNIVSLQSCTLPNYDRRIIVRAELKDVSRKPSQAGTAASRPV